MFCANLNYQKTTKVKSSKSTERDEKCQTSFQENIYILSSAPLRRFISVLNSNIYLLFNTSVFSEDGAACTLPDSKQTGECKRLLYCDSLWLPIKNQEIPYNDAKALVLKHSICETKSVSCDPNNIFSIVSKFHFFLGCLLSWKSFDSSQIYDGIISRNYTFTAPINYRHNHIHHESKRLECYKTA